MTSPKAYFGSALLSALFIMTLVAIAATAMSTRLQIAIYRTHSVITSDKLYLASQAVTYWTIDELSQNKPLSSSNRGGKLLDFPKKLESIYPQITVQGELYDLQAKFNINNLQDPKWHPYFFRFLKSVLKKTNNQERKVLLEAIKYWINPYQPGRGHDDYLQYYLKQSPAYLPSFQAMRNISELRLIKDMSPSQYQTLLANITALPEKTPINLNTAPEIILRSFGDGLNESQVSELLNARIMRGGIDPQQLSPLLQKLNIPSDQVTIESNYYLSIAMASTEDLHVVTYTMIKRLREKTGLVTIKIISQSLNTL